jgi:predicted O-linked N-acetylglucosamine transferase (SPINDLY family)
LECQQFEAALESCNTAIRLKPDDADAYSNRGNVLKELKQFDAALESYDKAIELKPDFANAHYNLGHTLFEAKKFEAAVASYEKAFSLKSDIDYLLGMLLHTRMQLCDWTEFYGNLVQVLGKVEGSAKVLEPFIVLSMVDSLAVQRKAAEIYCADKHPAAANLIWSGQRYEHKKIRVAYVSCDFWLHPATLNNIGVWERHDRERFEVIAISYGPVFQEDATPQGQMRARLVKAFDKFLDVGDKSDEQIARLMREMEVDIALDISGTMQGARQGIFAHKPAPVQVNLYGYTSGSSYMDYMVSDRVVIPPESQWGYTEKVVYMPTAWLANDPTREVSERQFSKQEMGLPEAGVVYCSFNNAYKMNPQMFDVWMRILQRVPGSVLWLQAAGQEKVKENLRKEASVRGVDPARLVFADKIESMAEHLARHRLADVFLDTLPFNAQTTAVDALWAGLPVLTCMGEGVIARMAGSVLMALGLEELVTNDWQEYEEKAVRIGLEAGYAKSLKEKLERNRKDSPLFDTKRLTRNMERAYEQMHERVQQGLGPQAFEVEARSGA